MNSVSSSTPKLTVTCWKSLYIKLTSLKVRYPDNVIESELSYSIEHFKQGISQFSCDAAQNQIELRENKNSTYMDSFYQRLSKILLVSKENCEEIFANYLLHNCNNSKTLLQERLETNIRAVLFATWTFYAQERLFFLKCYYHIISSSMDKDAPYNSVFKNFVDKMPIRERHASLIEQYNSLIVKELPSAASYGPLTETLTPLWISYNLREQLELLHLIILTTSQIDITLDDVDQLVKLIQITSFGRYQCYFYHHSHLTQSQQMLQQQIQYGITFYAMQVLSYGWRDDIYAKDPAKFKAHNKILYPTNYEAKQGPIIIAWILVSYYRITNSNTYMEQVSNEGFSFLDDDLWKLLDDAVHSNIMDMPAISKIIEPIVSDMVYRMFINFDTNAFHSLTTLSSLVTFFCKFSLSNNAISAVLQYFRERFPHDCACTFRILSAMLEESKDSAFKTEILNSLHRMRYAVRTDECKLRIVELNTYALEYDLLPLKYVENVVIPRGTKAVPDPDENIVAICKSLPIWDVMRNYLMMYLNGDNEDNLLITIREIVSFVERSLHEVKTINEDILKFSELVVRVIWKTSTNCNTVDELNLLAACIRMQSVLFCIMPEDIIKCFEIYNFLPGYPVRMKRKDINQYETYYTQSRIYMIVCCKEAKNGVYPVLFSYLNFFHNLVQNTLESWYTVAGVKFIFHVYNNVNNDFWKFEKREDRNVIIWNCIQVIHEILNHGLRDLYEHKYADSLVDFMVDEENENVSPTIYFITRTCVLSILNSANECTILSTAIIGDMALLENVVANACWTRGKSAMFINVITYSLSLIQRCLIFVEVEKKLKKTDISFDHLFQPDKCLALLSYRYNCFSDTLSNLALKLLVKLASMKENCMFSWLQYSNELLQKEFLYPLYSHSESNTVKASLLALMATCIMKQIVIADALLEIDKVRKICVEKLKPDSKWQNLLLFTSRFIRHTETKKETYLTGMHLSVLNVIYACWEKKLKVPQQYYKKSSKFWRCFTLPLHGEPNARFGGYGFILETVCHEMMGSKTMDSNLETVLQAFVNSENFTVWTKYCADLIDETPRLAAEFEAIPVSQSAVANSWKKFVQVITTQFGDLFDKPGKLAYPVLENLVPELSEAILRKKEKFLCDIYRICLNRWEKNCSETEWKDELLLSGKMFIYLNELYRDYSTPYFFSTLLEVGYKILKYGRENIAVLDEMGNKSNFLLACCNILNHTLEDFSTALIEQNGPASVEYAPLLLHLCFFTNIVDSLQLTDELMAFMMRETDFVNAVSKISNRVLAIGCGTKTARMLLLFQNFLFEKYPFLKTNFQYNDSILNIFQSVFPGEIPQNETELWRLYGDHERNNLFRLGLNFVTNLTTNVSNESKMLLVDFHSRNKQYLFTILRMITVTLKKEDLHLVIAVVSFYWRITKHICYCKSNEVDDLVEVMFLLFHCVKSAVSMLIQPSKMCSLLFGIPSHHLQQFFDDEDNTKDEKNLINATYEDLMFLVKVGVQALSTFCIDADTILSGMWPPENWCFRWLNKVKNRDECLFPILFFDHETVQEDFSILATYITLEHRAVTDRATVEKTLPVDKLIGNKLILLNHDESGETLCALSVFVLSQSSMYLLHSQVDQSKKLFFVNQIFVNLKEFIRNALNDKNPTEKFSLPYPVDDYEPLTLFESAPATVEKDSQSSNTDLECKMRTALLQLVAEIFFKLITTFKHT